MEAEITFHIKTRDEFTPDEMKRFEAIFLKLPAPSAQFNQFGLRYDMNVLNGLGKRNIFFPIEVMALFCEQRVKERCDAREQMPDLTFKGLKAMYHMINATAIGNTAYVALNSFYPKQKAHSLLLLEEIYKREVQKRN